MDEPKPRSAWWQKKRWASALLLWLLVAYPLSAWPIEYLGGRGLIPPGSPLARAIVTFYEPLRAVALDPGLQPRYGCEWYINALRCFYKLGQDHTAAD
jgi:hypothetical protein